MRDRFYKRYFILVVKYGINFRRFYLSLVLPLYKLPLPICPYTGMAILIDGN